MVHSLLSNFECLGSSPFHLQAVANVASLQSVMNPSSHPWIDALITKIANMAAPSTAKENIYMRLRRKVV